MAGRGRPAHAHEQPRPRGRRTPRDLIVYGGRGQAARSWEAFDAIVATLQRLEPDETLLVQSGKPVGVVRTHADAPRVLIANSNLVPHWATQEHFDDLAAKGLIMYGQMTAGSWIYIGTQGILQGTYETFAECGNAPLRRHPRRAPLRHRRLRRHGRRAAPGRHARRRHLPHRRCRPHPPRAPPRRPTTSTNSRRPRRRHRRAPSNASARRPPVSIGVHCNAVDLLERLLARNITPDVLTDQTSAHDPLNGYCPRRVHL
jgi:urocanate hydratase